MSYQYLSIVNILKLNRTKPTACGVRNCYRQKLPNVQSGFTLLELLVVMVIIGLLAGYVGPKYFAQIGKSEVKVARAQMDALSKALDQYRLDVGHYPITENGLAALNVMPNNARKWQGPYLKKNVPMDPWDKPYQYQMPGTHAEFDLWSYGSDGVSGGKSIAADIMNWE